MRRIPVVAALLILTAWAMAGPLDGATPVVELQLDFSGMEAFWSIADSLRREEQPTDEAWGRLLGSPGYRALTVSEFDPEYLRDAFTLALAPSREADRGELEGGRLARIVRHVHRASELEPELRAWADQLGTGSLEEVVAPALALVPDDWSDASPSIALVIFDFDARGYDPIVVDLLASMELDLGPFLAHESHHWIRNRHLAFDSRFAAPDEEALLWVLNQLQAEGIADRIDKKRWLDGEAEPPKAKAAYFTTYRDNLEAAPEHLRRLDGLIVELGSGGDLPPDFPDTLRQSVPQSGHPTGFFIAARIVELAGEPALVASCGDPFAFVELYQRAALEDPSLAPPFSEKALAVIRGLGDRVGISDTTAALEAELDALVDENDRDFLLETLARISPAERIRELLAYEEMQHQLGGGFHGLLPSPLGGVETLTPPADATSMLKTAVFLARCRQENRSGLKEVLPGFPFEFQGGFIPETGAAEPDGWHFSIDDSAIEGFLAALADGVITSEEAGKLAGLASNREMLRHRKDLGYVPKPLPSVESLAEMIASAGSGDPLDRLWAWLNPWNFFGYADMATETEGYGDFVAELRRHGDRLRASVLSRIAAHAPEGTRYEGVFALTIGCLIRGWATPEMPGLNVDQVKDDWQFLDRVMTHETYHNLQPQICPTLTGEPAIGFEDLAVVDLGSLRQEKLYEILAYTALEGTANFAAGPDGEVDASDNARAGAELLAEFVSRVVGDGDLEAADELIVQGLRNNGPLYALGYQLSAVIAAEEGPRAVGEWLATGPVSFVLQADSLARTEGTAWLSAEVIDAVKDLQKLIR